MAPSLFKQQSDMNCAYNIRDSKKVKWLKCGQINIGLKAILIDADVLSHMYDIICMRPIDIDSDKAMYQFL